MVTPFKDENFGSSRELLRGGQSEHVGLGAAVGEADEVDGRETSLDKAGKLGFRSCMGSKLQRISFRENVRACVCR